MKAGTKNQPNGSWKQFFMNKTADKARQVCVRRLQPSVCECADGYWHNGTECVLFSCDVCTENQTCDEENQECVDKVNPCDLCTDNEICEEGKCVFDCNTCAALDQVCNGDKDGCVQAGPCSNCPDGWGCDEATATCINPCDTDGDIFEYKWSTRKSFNQAQVGCQIDQSSSNYFNFFRNSAKAWDQNSSFQDLQIKQKTTKSLQNQRQSILLQLKIFGLMFFTRMVHGHLQMDMQIGQMKTKQGITSRKSTIFSVTLYLLTPSDEEFLESHKKRKIQKLMEMLL